MAGGPAHNSASSSIPAGSDARQHCTQYLVRRRTVVLWQLLTLSGVTL